MITRQTPLDSGRVLVKGADVSRHRPDQLVEAGLVRTFQQLRIFSKMTVLENVMLGFQQNPGERFSYLCLAPNRCAVQTERNREAAKSILDKVGLLEVADQEAGSLSYGMQKLLSLARVMATNADVIMLDEPTSGLSTELVQKLIRFVKDFRAGGKTIVLVEHDMDVVFEVSDWIIVLDQGRVFYEGLPEDVRSNDDVRTIYFGTRAG
jgi:ABC-type branched-subunit amino acid transport system ATPase component